MRERWHMGIHIDAGVLVAAAAGALVSALTMKETHPVRVLSIAVSSIFCGVFFGPLIVPWIPFRSEIEAAALANAGAAIASIAGLAMTNGIIAVVKVILKRMAAGELSGTERK